MTRDEAQAWKEWTQRSDDQWQVDPCHADMKADFLCYKGGIANGRYFEILGGRRLELYERLHGKKPALHPDPRRVKLVVGRYEDAYPHIGEALFHPSGTMYFSDSDAAIKFMVERGGVQFLIDLFKSGTVRQRLDGPVVGTGSGQARIAS